MSVDKAVRETESSRILASLEELQKIAYSILEKSERIAMLPQDPEAGKVQAEPQTFNEKTAVAISLLRGTLARARDCLDYFI